MITTNQNQTLHSLKQLNAFIPLRIGNTYYGNATKLNRTMTDVFDQLNDKKRRPTGFSDFWDHSEHPDQIVGVVAEIRDGPDQFTEVGEVPDPVYTIVATGRGDFEKGASISTPQRMQLVQGLQRADVDSLVIISYEGRDGNAYIYEVGVLSREEWENTDNAEEIQAVIDEWNGPYGDNREGIPKGGNANAGGSGNDNSADSGNSQSAVQQQMNQLTGGDSGGNSGGSNGNSNSSFDPEAVDFFHDLLAGQDGSMPEEQMDKMLNDIRGYGVDVEALALEQGCSVNNGTIEG